MATIGIPCCFVSLSLAFDLELLQAATAVANRSSYFASFASCSAFTSTSVAFAFGYHRLDHSSTPSDSAFKPFAACMPSTVGSTAAIVACFTAACEEYLAVALKDFIQFYFS